MGLFQKKPISISEPAYTIGDQKTLLIIGLGNPEKKYQDTRHNLGFMCLDNFAAKQEFPNWVEKKDLKCLLTSKNFNQTKVILAKPNTYMNNSGESLAALQRFYKIPSKDTLIVHDELDIDFGSIKIAFGGGSAGHNGLKSIISRGGQETGRMRIGIGPKKPEQIDSADFVLAKFSKVEEKHLSELLQETTSILSEYAFGDGQLATETRKFIF